MKAFKVIYQHGHFIDKESKKRIIPVQGEEYIITASPAAFSTEDAILEMPNPLTHSEKAAWALKEFGKGKYHKLYDVNQQLFFRIGISKTVKGDESTQYVFMCTLVEDLYLYLSKGKKGISEEDWRLANCQCVLEKCLLGGLTLSEKVTAISLNKLFSNTVMFYFSLQRSGSANVFSTFFKYTPDLVIYADAAILPHYKSIGKEREIFVKSRAK